MQKETKVYFIGAGPGDPELITLKGKRLIDTADVIIYAGSLVNREVLRDCKKQAKIYNSASMTLKEVVDVMSQSIESDLQVVRVHTGDPSMYGAIREQIDCLEKKGIASEVIPGVSSVFASAAVLGKEFTLPGVSQTLILTRIAGRTPVPELEDLKNLARSKSSMALFLSCSLVDKVEEKLLTSYDEETPVAIVYKATWPDQKIFRTELRNLSETVHKEGIRHTALILVGDFLSGKYEYSKLYDSNFSHTFRNVQKDA